MTVRVASDLVAVSSKRFLTDTDYMDVVFSYPCVFASDGTPSDSTGYFSLVSCEHGLTVKRDFLTMLDSFGAFAYCNAGHFYTEVTDA